MDVADDGRFAIGDQVRAADFEFEWSVLDAFEIDAFAFDQRP